jgi:AraC-like DNA-binding protein
MKDLLSDLLRSISLSGGIFLDARFTAPWSVMSQITPGECRPHLSNPLQLIGYHFVLEGSLLVSTDGTQPIEAHAGEIVLLPRNDAHILASAAGIEPVSGADLVLPPHGGMLARIDHGGGGAATHIVCGYLGSDEAYTPLLDSLPSVLTLNVRESTSRDWIDASMRYAAGELAAGRLASSGVVSRLSELLLAEAIRAYAETLPDSETGWLRGLRDPHVGRALTLLHGDVAKPWTAESLAAAVAMSRSAFVDRFGGLVGQPPIRYLTALRLQTARRRLRDGTTSLSRLAPSVGYASEEAFSRAFKREFGLSPSQWREQSAGE